LPICPQKNDENKMFFANKLKNP